MPIISPTGEVVTIVNENEISIQKPEGLVTVKANVLLKIKEISGERTFNLVPGVEAIPIEVFFTKDKNELNISIQVS